MGNLQERFISITEKRQKKHAIERRLEMMEKQRTFLLMEMESMSLQLKEEEQEVEEFESVTLSSVINALLSNKIEKLEKEKEELYIAKIKLEKLKDEFKRNQHEFEEMRKELQTYSQIEYAYESIIEEVTNQIIENNAEAVQELEGLIKRRYEFEKERLEQNEAIQEGTTILKELNSSKVYLEKARDWGEYDSAGVGLVATIKRYHYLDEAQELIHKIHWGLSKYHRTLEQLGVHQDKGIEEFLKVPDYFIDGIFLDYTLQPAIVKLIDSINELIVEIIGIDEAIRKEARNSEKKKEAIEISIDQLFAKYAK